MGKIVVFPGSKRPSHDISLSDGVQTWGLRLSSGPQSIQEIPQTPSTVHFTGGGTKFGDWEPGMSHIEQRTWEGGRGLDSFVDDATRYFDGKMAWTLTPGKLFPVPAWKFSNGYLDEIYEILPGDLGWHSIYGSLSNRQIAEPFVHSSAWANADTLRVWIRKVGNPSDLTMLFCPDATVIPNVGNPYTTKTITSSDQNENEMCLYTFDVSDAGTLSNTVSWIVFSANTADNAANHWDIGVDVDGGTGYYNDDGTWTLGAFSIYHRISSAIEDRKFHIFEFEGALYAVDQPADHTASKLYLNGDRGKATSGGATSLTDTDKSWTADEWIGAWVKIISGTGKGQARQITDNTTTALTVATWDKNPDSTSQYVIYHTDKWQDISPSTGDTFSNFVVDVCVVDDYVCFAQDPQSYILKMRFNSGASPPAHEFDYDGTNYASYLFTHFDQTNGVQIYRAYKYSSTIGRATPTAWATAMTFGTHFDVGESDLNINRIYSHDGKLYVWKPDGRYLINPDDTAQKAIGELGFTQSENNGEASLSWGLYSYFSWGGYSIQRLYDKSGDYDMTNIGPDRDEGLPDDRRGRCVALLGTPPGIVAAIQGDSYSSVLVQPHNGSGWHEIFRGWASGVKVDNIYFEDSYRPRLWFSVGGELVYQDWPRHSFNPLKDSGVTYHPEAHLISSTIDMGAARLPKLIKEISAAVENLSSDVEVHLDYQVNEDVGTSNWIDAGLFQINPTDTLPINAGEVYQIRFRLRLVTKDESTPPIVSATVLEGFARTPVKYQWNMRLKLSSTQRVKTGVSTDHDPDDLTTWLKEAAKSSKRIFMRAIWEQMDEKYVVVEPMSLLRTFTNDVLGYWGGEVTLSVREI